MTNVSATDARSNLFQIIQKTLRGHPPTRISYKGEGVIVLSEEDYESLLETAELLATPGLKDSIRKADQEIKKGEVFSFDEVFK